MNMLRFMNVFERGLVLGVVGLSFLIGGVSEARADDDNDSR